MEDLLPLQAASSIAGTLQQSLPTAPATQDALANLAHPQQPLSSAAATAGYSVPGASHNIVSSVGNITAFTEGTSLPLGAATPAQPAQQAPAADDSAPNNKKRRQKCGQCEPCKITVDCGSCINCINKTKFKQVCKQRKCNSLRRVRVSLLLQRQREKKGSC